MRLGRAARRFVRGLLTSEPAPEWEVLPEGWSARDPRIKGWNVESIGETQKAKWPEALQLASATGPLPVHLWATDLSRPPLSANTVLMAFGYVLALTAWKKDHVSLLDWGGGLGHYKLVSQALLPQVEIEYHCKDVPLLCKVGRELQPTATFHEDDEDCFGRDYDLVMASGSLEYSEDWKGVLRRLAQASRRYLYVTRLPLVHRAASFTVVQRPYRYGYVTEYVSWVVNRQEFLSHVGSLGMPLVREIVLAEGPAIRGAPEPCEIRGFLFERAESQDVRR
jgi:putative methyltransferase (TIGR04325 family)